MSKPTDTGKAETLPESAGTKAPIWGAPLEGKVAIVTGGGKRFNASKWRGDLPVEEAGPLCARDAGVYEGSRDLFRAPD
jgi:hypothetical protein